jgi:hypothetical protein
MARKSHTISSREELLQVVPQIIEEINADPALTLRFAANPLLLAEELGYTLTDEVKHFAARRVRFPTETFERLEQLEQQIWEQADERFDIDSEEALAHILFTKLGLPSSLDQATSPPAQPKKRSQKTKKSKQPSQEQHDFTPPDQQAALPIATAPLRPRVIGHAPIDDPLEALRDVHPIMTPLLEYRQLEASSARFAPRALYERIRRGEVELPITQLKLRLKNIPKP